jgi:hypothetical protein
MVDRVGNALTVFLTKKIQSLVTYVFINLDVRIAKVLVDLTKPMIGKASVTTQGHKTQYIRSFSCFELTVVVPDGSEGDIVDVLTTSQ